MHKPDRPIKPFLAPLRTLMRSIRLLYHRVKLGRKLSYGNNVFFGRRCSLLPPQCLVIGNDVALGAGFHLETRQIFCDNGSRADYATTGNSNIAYNDDSVTDQVIALYDNA